MKRIATVTGIFLFAFLQQFIAAQPASFPIAMTRQYVHYNLEKQQKSLLGLDGLADDQLWGGDNEDINLQLTYTATTQLTNLRKEIELDTTLDNNQKITYLRGLGEVLGSFAKSVKSRRIKIISLPDVVNAWTAAYQLNKKNESLSPVISRYPHAVGTIILQGISFMHNPKLPEARNYLVLKYIEEHPGKILTALATNPNVPYADSLISLLITKDPDGLYSFAQAKSSPLGRRIHQHPDKDVQLLAQLSLDNYGQMYLPFFDNLRRNLITTEAIKKAAKDSVAYFKLLVKTQIEYAGRAATGDTPVAWRKLSQMLHDKAYQPFINEVNELHASPDAVRFRILNPMGAQELYYLSFVCEQEIYTSSYVGIYHRIWQRMKVPDADTLLSWVNNDHYKKFISMAANYNTLDNFLGRMTKEHATTLMTRFVNNLDETGDLEDAVDVASSYASITHPQIKKLMLDQITSNYDRSLASGNKRAQTIYRLEKLILSSSDSGSNINLSDSLGILPVYDVNNKYLQDSAGRIVLQMFFYGDDGGRGSYERFKSLYSNSGWKRTDNPEWVQFTSNNTTVPFVLFANRPGDENKNEDAIAQQHLAEWLEKHGYAPSIVVHRGHSYFLKSTVKQLPSSSKVIILGSCGAYHTMDDILSTCPDAYLVGSKQTGYGAINIPLFTILVEHLKKGADVNWPAYWSAVRKSLSPAMQPEFDDYIPPYKNLGATFINAYKKAAEKENQMAGIIDDPME